MFDSSEYMPSTNESLIKTFCNMFEGSFRASAVSGEVSYYDKEFNEFELPETKIEFIDMVSKSIKQKKNLFLDKPVKYGTLPENAII